MPLIQQKVHSAVSRDVLLHGKTLFVIPTTDLNHTILFFIQSLSRDSCGHVLLIQCPKLAFIVHLDDFLTAGGQEGGVQLHPGTDNCLEGNMRKSCSTFVKGEDSGQRGARNLRAYNTLTQKLNSVFRIQVGWITTNYL